MKLGQTEKELLTALAFVVLFLPVIYVINLLVLFLYEKIMYVSPEFLQAALS